MPAVPLPFPLIARLRYACRAGGETLPMIENAWWESRLDGGRVLGAVVEAMAALRHPHRLRVHLRLKRDGTPREMEITLLRPDGEGRATYRFEARAVRSNGVWNGTEFSDTTPVPEGYTVAPHCLAADGLHFSAVAGSGMRATVHCYLIDPRSPERPLIGSPAAFTAEPLGEETLDIDGRNVVASRYRTAYEGSNDSVAEFWVSDRGYALRMTSARSDGTPFEIVCDRLTEGFHPTESNLASF